MRSRSVSFRVKAAVVAACAAFASAGCSGDDDSPAASGPPQPATLADCTTAAKATYAGTTLTATSVAAGTLVGGIAAPAHCLVQGRMNARTGSDGKAYYTGFELRLPLAWDGRFVFQGGGGNDGVIRPAIGSPSGGASALGLNSGALVGGSAVVSTDAGHQQTDATFGLDNQARIDHAYASYDKVTLAAKSIIAQTYGRGPGRSYFVGCSGGGRQALLFPQRFPDYFDGVSANAPAIKVAKEATVASVWDVVTYSAIAPKDAGGSPILAQALSDADLALVSNAILARCDVLDGAVDGIIHANPAACTFDPAVLQCTGAKNDTCLSAAQVAALKKDFGGPRNSAGQPLYASWPWDAGVRGADWRNWRLGTSTTAASNARDVTLIAADAMRYEFFTPPDPTFNYMAFNFDADPARMNAYASIYHTTSTDVAAFRDRGGKMLIVHGVSDPIFSANDSIDYYERLAAANGGIAQTKGYARLYLVPGMNHCANSGGPATDLYDSLAPLVAWVENGTAPDRIVAKAGAATPWPGRTRPLCPYPQQAHYDGSGSVEDAASFTCR